MPIYLSFNRVPELATRAESERQAAIKRVNNLAMKHWEWWVALLVAALLTAVGAWFGGKGTSGVIGAGIGGAVGGAVVHVAVIHIARKYHSAVLEGRGDT